MENKYVLLDTGRNSYWKKNNFGYTKFLKLAKIFTLEEANEKANAPSVKDLKVIPYLEADRTLEGYDIEMFVNGEKIY